MSPLALLSIIPFFIGFWLGWRGSRRWSVLLMQAVVITLVFLTVFLLAFMNRSQPLDARYIWTAAQYWLIPYTVFLLIPCIVAEAIGKAIRNPSSQGAEKTVNS